jgi:hypothetical protein
VYVCFIAVSFAYFRVISLRQSLVSGVYIAVVISRVEAGSRTSTVALLFVGGEEKGSLESETVKYVVSPTALGPYSEPRVEAGSNTSTLTPLVLGGDEKGRPVSGGYK